jgi:hypothetical protein
MNERRNSIVLGLIAGAAGVLVVLGATGLIIVYTGAYNVAATEEHAAVTRWAFDTTFHHSVERRAATFVPPDGLTPTAGAAASRRCASTVTPDRASSRRTGQAECVQGRHT